MKKKIINLLVEFRYRHMNEWYKLKNGNLYLDFLRLETKISNLLMEEKNMEKRYIVYETYDDKNYHTTDNEEELWAIRDKNPRCVILDTHKKTMWHKIKPSVIEEYKKNYKQITYKGYTICADYSAEDNCYYPYIMDNDLTEILDGEDVYMCETPDEAITEGKKFIDELV